MCRRLRSQNGGNMIELLRIGESPEACMRCKHLVRTQWTPITNKCCRSHYVQPGSSGDTFFLSLCQPVWSKKSGTPRTDSAAPKALKTASCSEHEWEREREAFFFFFSPGREIAHFSLPWRQHLKSKKKENYKFSCGLCQPMCLNSLGWLTTAANLHAN